MAHKTFISYKYSEARDLRDRIIEALGDDATYYKGETSDSPDLTDSSTENIKRVLRDMMYDTSVTIVIISPHMNDITLQKTKPRLISINLGFPQILTLSASHRIHI